MPFKHKGSTYAICPHIVTDPAKALLVVLAATLPLGVLEVLLHRWKAFYSLKRVFQRTQSSQYSRNISVQAPRIGILSNNGIMNMRSKGLFPRHDRIEGLHKNSKGFGVLYTLWRMSYSST